jgi:hypothetical protein
MPQWEYLTVFISGALDFPETVDRSEMLKWGSKSISQQLNAFAEQEWEIIDQHWLSDIEMMVTFRRPSIADQEAETDHDRQVD